MLAYKVMVSYDPKVPIGQVFLEEIWHGRRFEVERYDYASLSFKKRFVARYLGRVTARTERGRIKQLLDLPGMSKAKADARARGFYSRSKG